jgi:hypothetical protein
MTQEDIDYCVECYIKALEEIIQNLKDAKFKDTAEDRRCMNRIATRLSKLQDEI